MEHAILRYQKNRRIVNDRREVFSCYLAFGGVDVGPKMFAGVDDREIQGMDKEQIMLVKAQESIKQDHAELAIDFNAVVTSYLLAIP